MASTTMALSRTFLLILVCLSLLSATVSALYCLQCQSTNDPRCASGQLRPKKCPRPSFGCTSYFGKMPSPDEHFVWRDCADQPVSGSFCQSIPGNDMEDHSICIYSCKSNGCNTHRVPTLWQLPWDYRK